MCSHYQAVKDRERIAAVESVIRLRHLRTQV